MPTAAKRLKTQATLLALTVASFAATTDAAGTTTYALPVLPAGSASMPVDNRFDGKSVLHDNATIAAAFNAKGRKAAVDIGHLTEWDGAAPAFGWIASLFVAEDGSLWAACELTAEGAALVDGKRFGYTSPTLRGVFTESGDWMALSVKSLALTNNPALEMASTFTAEGEDETDEDEAPAAVESAAALTAEVPAEQAPATEVNPEAESTASLTAAPAAAETVALTAFVELQGTVATLTSERDAAAAQVVVLTQRADALASEVATLTAARDAAVADLAAFSAANQTAAVQAAIDAANVAGKAFPFERDVLTAYAAAHGLDKLNSYLSARPSAGVFARSAAGQVEEAELVPADVQEFLAKQHLPLDAYRRGLS